MFTTTFLVIDRHETGQQIVHEVYVNYRAQAERGPGLDGMVDVQDVEIDSIKETTLWFGKIDCGVVSLRVNPALPHLKGHFEKSVLAELRARLAKSQSTGGEFYDSICETCAKAYRDELSYAD